ncbi:hypothetical protein IPH19_00640 [Candidatus Uhrbacteria bacterium]|nr:MAG: hypothetical protein IPH19_00640 [Candidatus Uhrbacteria bacterium]
MNETPHSTKTGLIVAIICLVIAFFLGNLYIGFLAISALGYGGSASVPWFILALLYGGPFIILMILLTPIIFLAKGQNRVKTISIYLVCAFLIPVIIVGRIFLSQFFMQQSSERAVRGLPAIREIMEGKWKTNFAGTQLTFDLKNVEASDHQMSMVLYRGLDEQFYTTGTVGLSPLPNGTYTISFATALNSRRPEKFRYWGVIDSASKDRLVFKLHEYGYYQGEMSIDAESSKQLVLIRAE